MDDKYSGIYRDRDPIPDKRINQMDDRLVKAEGELFHVQELLRKGITQLEFEDLYKRVKKLSGLIGGLDDDILAIREEIIKEGNRITENTSKIEMTPELIRLSVQSIETDLLSKALKESRAMFEILAGQITSEVTKKEFDELGRQVKNAQSLIRQTSESITQLVTRAEYSELGDIVENNRSRIQQLSDEIDLSVTRDEFNELGELVEMNESSITLNHNAINLRVTQEVNTLDGKFANYSTISQTANAIELRVSAEVDTINAKFADYSTITQTATQINSRVAKTDYTGQYIIESLINQTADSIKIRAQNINLEGALTISAFTLLDKNALSQSISDSAAAKSLTDIWKYGATTKINGGLIETGTVVALGPVTAGSFNLGNNNFIVTDQGLMTARGAVITGGATGTITLSSETLPYLELSGAGRYTRIDYQGFSTQFAVAKYLLVGRQTSDEPNTESAMFLSQDYIFARTGWLPDKTGDYQGRIGAYDADPNWVFYRNTLHGPVLNVRSLNAFGSITINGVPVGGGGSSDTLQSVMERGNSFTVYSDGIANSLALRNSATGNNTGTAIYMGYAAGSPSSYGIRLLQMGWPAQSYGSSFYIQSKIGSGIEDYTNLLSIYQNGNTTVAGVLDTAAVSITQAEGVGTGLSLYASYAGGQPNYGLMFAKTANYSTHGYVGGLWATYNTTHDPTYGWIFRTVGTASNVASISAQGHAYFNGVVTAGDAFLASDFGVGLVGVYASDRYQEVFSMGDAYRPNRNGIGLANHYGIVWTHQHVEGQSIQGLHHQMLITEAGVTQTAIGKGIWTLGNINSIAHIAGAAIFDNGSRVLSQQGQSYYQVDSWLQLNGPHGFYCPTINGAHLNPNTAGTYGTWLISGNRNGYGGFHDSYSGINFGMYASGGGGGDYDTVTGLWIYYYLRASNSVTFSGQINAPHLVVATDLRIPIGRPPNAGPGSIWIA